MSALKDYDGIISLCRIAIDRMDRGDAGFQFMAMDEGIRRAVIALTDELEQRDADAALGALVRQMQNGWALQCYGMGDLGMCWIVHEMYDDEPLTAGECTPEAALKEALGEQDDR